MKNIKLVLFALCLAGSIIWFGIYTLAVHFILDKEDRLKIGGSGTFKQSILTPEIEENLKKLYHNYTINATNTGEGLIGLKNDKFDMLMAIGSLDTITNKLNEKKGIKDPIDINLYKEHYITTIPLTIFVHPKNPIKKLTREQFKDIFSGKIRNWKEIDDSFDQEITIVASALSGGSRYIIEKEADIKLISGKIQTVVSTAESKEAVANNISAIGYTTATKKAQSKMSSTAEKNQVKIIPVENLIIRVTFNLVTLKNPTENQLRFIDAVRKANDIF